MKNPKAILSLVVMVLLASTLPAESADNQVRKQPTCRECCFIFPHADNIEFARGADGETYCVARFKGFGEGEDTPEFFGYVFARNVSFGGNEMRVLVGLNPEGKIAGLKVLGNYAVDEKFLDQFKGRTLSDGVEIAARPEDLLYVPSKIRPMRDNVPLSQAIANTVHNVLTSGAYILSKTVER